MRRVERMCDNLGPSESNDLIAKIEEIKEPFAEELKNSWQ